MARNNERKLNHFLSTSSGEVLTTEWLEEQNISPKLAWWYIQSGLLERLGMKAYKKSGDNIRWPGVVSALQNQMQLSVHVGGKTALQVQSQNHFSLPQEIEQVQLFAALNTRMPSWLEKQPSKAEFSIHRTSLFSNSDQNPGIILRRIDGITIMLSCPERAAMEIIYLYPKHEPLEDISPLLKNLDQLRPAIIQSLLERCHSIKVKRLFLFLAEQYQHPWLAALDLKKIDLGSGKRVIATGGKYHSKYKISFPEIN